MTNTTTCPTGQPVLNDDILLRILGYLSKPTLAVCLRVCTKFYNIAGPMVYQTVTVKEWSEALSMIQAVDVRPRPETRRRPADRNTILPLLRYTRLLIVHMHFNCGSVDYLPLGKLTREVSTLRVTPSWRCQTGCENRCHRPSIYERYYNQVLPTISSVDHFILHCVHTPYRPVAQIQARQSFTVMVTWRQAMTGPFLGECLGRLVGATPTVRVIFTLESLDEHMPDDNPKQLTAYETLPHAKLFDPWTTEVAVFCFTLMEGRSNTFEFVMMDNLFACPEYRWWSEWDSVPESLERFRTREPDISIPPYRFISRAEYLKQSQTGFDQRELEAYTELECETQLLLDAGGLRPLPSDPRDVIPSASMCLPGGWTYMTVG